MANEQILVSPQRIRVNLLKYLTHHDGWSCGGDCRTAKQALGCDDRQRTNAVEPCDYIRYVGFEAAGLRVANEIERLRHILL